MTTFTVIFPHAAGTPISVLRHPPFAHALDYAYHPLVATTYRASLPSVLRLVRLSTNKPALVPHPSGCALEIVVNA